MNKEQKEAMTFLIRCTEFAQGKGILSLLEANKAFNSINVLIPLLEEKEQ
ncbi:hypothetical protein [Tenacibaculum sp. 190130A14a]|uniref:Uncharacterized protein n=1 Tax=Tenacibaculum polynesiense TaxID=3137857 RepID=A0ABP1EXW6_9FLAO